MKPTSLKGRKRNQRVLRHGKRWRGNTFIVSYIVLPLQQESVESVVQMGSFAPVKLHKSAVARNRMRRRCKEALRLALKDVQKIPSLQLLICPKSSSLDSDYQLICKDAQAFIQFLTSYDSKHD